MKTETANGVVSGWNYDSDFRVVSHVIADAGVAFTYDNDSLLTVAGVATLTRSPDSGFLTALTVGTVATAYGYNGYGEVESVNTGALYSEGLQYDSAGRLTVMQESVNGTPTQYTYTYDSVGRLTSATKDGTTTTSWTYDGNGNRLTENGVSSTFDAQDRLLTKGTTTYTWDALGGRKTKTEGGQTTQYTHDGLGALLSVTLPDSTQLTYEYDARQRRVAKRRNGTLEARWVYDGQYRVAAQLDASGAVTHRFVYGSQSHSPDYVVTGGVTYAYVKNHLGSIRFVVNAATSTVAQQLDYDAWGNVLTDSAPGFQPFAFAGGIYDRDTKLTHFGFRDYDSTVGVWTAKDPIRLLGGLNAYSYVSDSPIRLLDSSGLSEEEKLRILAEYSSYLESETQAGRRRDGNGAVTDFVSVFSRVESCGAQADRLIGHLSDSLNFKDYKMVFQPIRGRDPVLAHQWVYMYSYVDNEQLILDPFLGTTWSAPFSGTQEFSTEVAWDQQFPQAGSSTWTPIFQR